MLMMLCDTESESNRVELYLRRFEKKNFDGIMRIFVASSDAVAGPRL